MFDIEKYIATLYVRRSSNTSRVAQSHVYNTDCFFSEGGAMTCSYVHLDSPLLIFTTFVFCPYDIIFLETTNII